MNLAHCPVCQGAYLVVPGCTQPQAHTFTYGLEPKFRNMVLPERCRDCGARIGRPHHPGCVVADCSVCEGQAWGCAHDDRPTRISEPDERGNGVN